MSSRGSKATNGHVTTSEYTTASITDSGVKILKGIGNNHSLPDYSHSPNSIYAKLKKMVKHFMKCAFMIKMEIQ